jgi:DNA-binding beta-propeller fold protein YncE
VATDQRLDPRLAVPGRFDEKMGRVGNRSQPARPLCRFNDNRILRYSATTGAFLAEFVPADGGGLAAPSGMIYGPDGNLYVGGSYSDNVLRYNGTTGAYIDTFIPAGSGGLDTPASVLFGPDGNLHVASFRNDRVLRYNGMTGAFLGVFASGIGLDGPR